MNARKDDAGKLRMELIPAEAIEELAKILTMGANKYEDNSWQGIEQSRYEGALLRHINLHRKGEKFDEESGELHLSHALCNIVFMLCKEINEVKYGK